MLQTITNPYTIEKLNRNLAFCVTYKKKKYNYDGVYGPIPDENGYVDLSYYAKNYISDYKNIIEIPRENLEYLHSNIKPNNMNYMFEDCEKLKNIDISYINTNEVNNMSYVFANCISLINLNISNNFVTEKCTTIQGMFYHCESLEYIPNLDKFVTNNVQVIRYLFQGCKNLKEVNINNWNLNSLIGEMNGAISYLFYECQSLTSIDLSSWNIPDVHNIYNFCYNCLNLEYVALDNLYKTYFKYSKYVL